jgi:hypothetical protein
MLAHQLSTAIGGEFCRKLAVALVEAIRRGSDRECEGVSHHQQVSLRKRKTWRW